MSFSVRAIFAVFSLVVAIQPLQAQEQSTTSLLTDVNGDGQVRILAFGDSLTYGVGDGIASGVYVETPTLTDGTKGYPMRVEVISGVLVDNNGSPGETFSIDGVSRLVRAVLGSSADIVVFMEGTNDSFLQINPTQYRILLQRVINVVKALGRKVVVLTLPPTCCLHDGREPYLNGYNFHIRDLANVNQVAIGDIDLAWYTSCVNKDECEFLNIPEGLHPNQLGYDVIAQVILAALADIDLFALDGASQLEAAFGLTPGSVLVKPLS